MEKDRSRRYVENLERTVQKDHQQLQKAAEELQKNCLMAISERKVSVRIITYVRKTYREIRTLIAEIMAVQRLLKGKYRQYAARNFLRDKRIAELGFLVKALYGKFENSLKLSKRRDRGSEAAAGRPDEPSTAPERRDETIGKGPGNG